jgi:hypothetical protein
VPGPARRFTPRLLTAKTATQLDFPAGRQRLGAAIAGVLVAAYLGWSLAVSAGGHLSSGERRIYLLLLLLVLTFLLGLSAYFGVKRFDSAVDGWRIASPPARVLLPAGYVLVGVFPLAVLAAAALLMDMEVFGAARVRHLLTHLGSISLDPRAWYLILAPLALGLAVGVLFVPQWHYSLAPSRLCAGSTASSMTFRTIFPTRSRPCSTPGSTSCGSAGTHHLAQTC